MSFTVTCDKCGEQQKYKNGDRGFQNNIEIEVTGFGDTNVLNIYCCNPDCPNQIDLID
ncbi:hypothetical protein ACUXCC_005636 [Cytobacillus horneckiae]|uniref:hypothetical protein n=1 Tax=Cytobacillus horneckiae TaxID=549687 RepID=UPI0019D0E495|nr:hypothetical protein [Cytobacillus horneckiae]